MTSEVRQQRSDKSLGLSKACEYCRTRKIRCDSQKPRCGSCVSQHRECVFKERTAKERPTLAALNSLRKEKKRLQEIIDGLKNSSHDAVVAGILASFPSSLDHQPTRTSPSNDMAVADIMTNIDPSLEHAQSSPHDSETDPDVSPFISVDEEGNLASFGPSSALQSPMCRPSTVPTVSEREHQRNSLIANAVITRQQEHALHSLQDLDGVPIELAIHLLNLHWNRQHHTFLLTYRPAIMRDLFYGGPYASRFLLNAIFACAAKFSQRPDVQEVAGDTATSGARWFRRCDQLLYEDKLLLNPSIPTVVGLALLGSTYNARGEISKGWLLMGYALRMVYDLGLHIERVATPESAEEAEIRRRVFWGVFVCDKLQSLYLGRPIAMRFADTHVLPDFLDGMEEGELWTPYIDPKMPDVEYELAFAGTPTRSVSCFQQLCSLSKIMEKVINNNYVIGATSEKARKGLRRIDDSLEKWMENLPKGLQIPLAEETMPHAPPSPNIFNIHAIYHTLVVLLHRPIIADGHLYAASDSPMSLLRCTIAARAITLTVRKFHASYSLRGAPYLIAYALYVACTIHVRNAAMFEQMTGQGEHCTLLSSSLYLLEQIGVPNPGVSRPTAIIRRLMATKGISLVQVDHNSYQLSQQETAMPENLLQVDNFMELDFPGSQTIANWLGDPQDPFRDDQLYGFMDTL
ncbi:fungal-specific transcription factor domain-containing protein [Cadophora sp. MPI-SDFR-AT-0126]|nr:fungal-specific transcription factor domain-containing protein [Leotiomycetes sp. MPI-SDFR-AT-0126]